MVCKGSTCKGGEVPEASREADRVVIKVVIKVVTNKEVIKVVTEEDISVAHRAMAIVDITRATTAPMVVTKIKTTITNNNIPTRNKGEEARANHLGPNGGKGCIAWPNTGRTNSTTLPV